MACVVVTCHELLQFIFIFIVYKSRGLPNTCAILWLLHNLVEAMVISPGRQGCVPCGNTSYVAEH